MKFRWISAWILIVLLVSSCGGGQSSQIEIEDPWARAASMGGQNHMGGENREGGEMMKMNGAVYMIIKNKGGETDKLLHAKSDVAEVVELHLSSMVDGVMKMEPQEAIEAPARGQATLKPGSYHIMLIGLQRPLVVGETFNINLTFEQAGDVTVEVDVREP